MVEKGGLHTGYGVIQEESDEASHKHVGTEQHGEHLVQARHAWNNDRGEVRGECPIGAPTLKTWAQS